MLFQTDAAKPPFHSDESQELERNVLEALQRIKFVAEEKPSKVIDRLGPSAVYDILQNYSKTLRYSVIQGLQAELRKRGLSDMSEYVGNTKELNRTSLESAPEPTDKLVKKAKKLLAKELKLLSKDFEKMSEDVDNRNYVSNNLETIESYILGVRTLRELLKPVVSDKHTMDIIEHMDFVEDYINSQNDDFDSKYHTRDLEFRIDFNTPNGKMYTQKRKYTVPQQDAAIRLHNLTSFIVKNFPSLLAMLRNHRESAAIQKAERKMKVSKKQSNSA